MWIRVGLNFLTRHGKLSHILSRHYKKQFFHVMNCVDILCACLHMPRKRLVFGSHPILFSAAILSSISNDSRFTLLTDRRRHTSRNADNLMRQHSIGPTFPIWNPLAHSYTEELNVEGKRARFRGSGAGTWYLRPEGLLERCEGCLPSRSTGISTPRKDNLTERPISRSYLNKEAHKRRYT